MTLPASADMKLMSLKTLLNTYITDYIEKNIEKFYQNMHILTQIIHATSEDNCCQMTIILEHIMIRKEESA